MLSKLKNSLAKTRQSFVSKVENLVKGNHADFYEELEETMIQADMGVKTTLEIIEELKSRIKENRLTETEQVLEALKESIASLMHHDACRLNFARQGPTVILVVGVNGVGKTTSIAKLAHRFKAQGMKVLLVAGDTFRAAAVEQLQVWANRIGVDVIKHNTGADPGAVVFDGIKAALARKSDVVIVDTAGRLHNKTNLMEELAKLHRVIGREIPEAPHEVLLVLDATTGQNAISQARTFQEITGVTGIILTKLDGTAKGGIVVAVARELNIPVKLIGVGEGLEDLEEFSGVQFVQALFNR